MKEGGDVKEKEEEDHQRSFSKEPPAVPAARDLQLDQQQTEDGIVFLYIFQTQILLQNVDLISKSILKGCVKLRSVAPGCKQAHVLNL